MKTLLRKNKYFVVILGIVGCVVVISCQTSKTSKVEIGKRNVAIHPGVKLTPEGEQAMNNVLKHYNKNLYRIEILENGQVKKAMGNAAVEGPLQAELAAAKSKGVSVSGIGSACPNVGCPANQNIASKDLRKLEDLKKILAKYQ